MNVLCMAFSLDRCDQTVFAQLLARLLIVTDRIRCIGHGMRRNRLRLCVFKRGHDRLVVASFSIILLQTILLLRRTSRIVRLEWNHEGRTANNTW